MALQPGARLGPYEILGAIGAGGMGEVYKARDTRLQRVVAIKVLPPEWVSDPVARERFNREAHTIASLKHPHICVLYDVGEQEGLAYLVMEHLEGETLAERLKRGPVPIDEALGVAVAIGDALDKAHRQGVIHRDLKPANVMMTASGPKLLDFGIAKKAAALPAGTTITMTLPGTVLGTMQYMAPEQLDGADADRRTDIFAFGVVVHEMVTGKKAFEGKSQALLISAIATSDPPAPSQIKADVPLAVDRVVKACLEKDPENRWQDVRDLVAELQWIAEGGADTGFTSVAAGRAGRLRSWVRRGALVAGLAAIGLLAWPAYRFLQGAPDPEEIRFRVPRNLTKTPEETNTGNTANGGLNTFSRPNSAISPDGRSIAFVARPTNDGTWIMYVRPVDAVTPQKLVGTEDAVLPFWSADNRTIAYWTRAGKIRKVVASGGPPQDVCDAPDFTGGTWNQDGTILFGTKTGVYRVSAEGGTAAAVTTLGPSEGGHFWPRFLPDGRHFLFLVRSSQPQNAGVFVSALDSKDKSKVLAADSNAAYAESDGKHGYLVFQREGAVFAQPFNPATAALSGQPARIADQVMNEPSVGQGYFDVSKNGVLIYFANSTSSGGSGDDTWEFQMLWADRSAQSLGTVGPYGFYRGVELSPDGKRVAAHRHDGKGGDIWVIEPPPRAQTRITFDAAQDNSSPVWSSDGKRIVFASHRNDKWGLYLTPSDGSGTDGDLLLESETPVAPMSWAPDGKRLVYWVQTSKTQGDLWILPFDGDKKPVPFLVSTKNETHAQVSPDGKWIAYCSDLTGRKEVFVQPFPSGPGRWQVSPNEGIGGDWPRWRHDSQELYYHSLINAGAYGVYTGGNAFIGPIYAVSIKAVGGSIEAGAPKEAVRLLALRFAHPGGDYHSYDVSADGMRFLTYQRVLTGGSAATTITPEVPIQGLTVAMNWMTALNRK